MGFYYGSDGDGAPGKEKPPGCLETLIVTRAVFGVLIWPLLAFAAIGLTIGVTIWLFAMHPALALIPVALAAVGIFFYARWEQQRFRPPGL
jgi:hypothetical protein